MHIGEYIAYMRGATLHNSDKHRSYATTSEGFCFFAGNPDEWAHRLNGLVEFDVLLTVDAPAEAVRRAKGSYVDWTDSANPKDKWFTEYCTRHYSKATFAMMGVDLSYGDNPDFVPRSQMPGAMRQLVDNILNQQISLLNPAYFDDGV